MEANPHSIAIPVMVSRFSANRRLAFSFRTQTLLQMAMAGHLAGKTIRFDPAKREMIV